MGEISPEDFTRYISALDINKVQMLGSGYVVEYCISAFLFECKENVYKNYVCNCLQLIAENTAISSGGKYTKLSYNEILNPKPVDNRPVEDIIEDIINRTGIKQRE